LRAGTFLAIIEEIKHENTVHELSVAQNIIDLVLRHVPAEECGRVHAVRLKVGAAAGIVPDSLEFSFAAIAPESPLRNAHLEIIRVPFRVRCNACGTTEENELGTALCARCGSGDTAVLSGTELHVTEIEIAEPAEAAS